MSRLLRTLLQNLYYTTNILREPLLSKISVKEHSTIKSLSLCKSLQYMAVSIRSCSNTSSFSPSNLNNNKIDDGHSSSDSEDVLTCIVPKIEDQLIYEELDHLLPSQRQKHHDDVLISKIYDCQTAFELFDIRRRHQDVMNLRHHLAMLRLLNNLVSQGVENGTRLQETHDFRGLCREIYASTRQMEHEELLEVLKHLCRLEVSPQSKLVQTVLQMLKYYINDLDLRQIVFLEFLLRKMPATTLSDALKTALPVLVENSLAQEPLDHLSMTELSQILSICVRGMVRNIGVILQEIYKRGSITQAMSGLSIIWSLTEMTARHRKKLALAREDLLTREVLIKECLEAIAKDMSSLTAVKMESTLSKVSEAYEKRDFCYYNERFLHAVSVHAVHKNLGFIRVAHIIRKLLQMNYMSEDLVHYMVSLVLENPQDVPEAKVGVMPLFASMSACEHTPNNIQEALEILMNHKSIALDGEDYFKKPLLSIAQELLSLGYCHPKLVKLITNPDTLSIYLSKYSLQDRNHKTLLVIDQALGKLFQSPDRVPERFLENGRRLLRTHLPAKSDLKVMLHHLLDKPEHVLSGVITDGDAFIDHLVVLDEEGYPISLNPPEARLRRNIDINSLEIPENYTRIAILDIGSSYIYKPCDYLNGSVRLRRRLLETEDFTVVSILQAIIFRYPAEEKVLHVKRELINAGVNFR